METLQTKLSQKRRLNYPMLSPSIFQMGLNSLIKEHHKLQEALEVTCRAVGSLSKNYQNMVSDMLPLRDLFLGTSSYHIIIRGTLRYYNARNVIGQGPRYNNPNKDITGLGKEFIIFNQDALDMYSSIFICEGAINALTMGDRAIATMGKAISAYQVNQLIKSPVNRFILLLDFDARDYAINLALKLVAYKKVKVVLFKDNRDVNDLGKKAVLKMVYKTRYQSYQDLIKLRNEK